MIKPQLVWSGLIKAGKSDIGFKSAVYRSRKQILSCCFILPLTIVRVQIVKNTQWQLFTVNYLILS